MIFLGFDVSAALGWQRLNYYTGNTSLLLGLSVFLAPVYPAVYLWPNSSPCPS
jgi:hypothetical protein